MVKEVDRVPNLTPSNIASLYCSIFKPSDVPPSQRRTAARAILRHHAHADNNHCEVRKPSGLHPSYIALHSPGDGDLAEQAEIKYMLRESLADVLDAVSPLLSYSFHLINLIF
jgi:hypothetical protein